jgi:hypothetical protein
VNGLEPPYESIADERLNGTVVPSFGPAASAVYRPAGPAAWEPGKPFLPFGAELAASLGARVEIRRGRRGILLLPKVTQRGQR